MLEIMLVVFGFIVILVCTTLVRAVFLVQQAEAMVIERFGRYHGTLYPGIHLVIPFIDIPRSSTWSFFKETEGKRYYRYMKTFNRIDLRETVYDFPKQNVITKDNVAIEINALLYYQITDPRAAIYEVANLSEAIEKLTHATLRNVVGSMDLDESLVSRDRINAKLRMILDEATDKWGVKINRVELQEITPPADIRSAMEKQMRAERERRAVILEAEGAKGAAILRAEGDRESEVLAARGIAESQVIKAEAEAAARVTIAQAEAEALVLVQQAIPDQDVTAYMISLQYLKTLPEMTSGKDNKLVVIPYEASGMMGSVAALKELFAKSNVNKIQ